MNDDFIVGEFEKLNGEQLLALKVIHRMTRMQVFMFTMQKIQSSTLSDM